MSGRHAVCCRLLVILMVMCIPVATNAQMVRFGVWTQIWPWMWEGGRILGSYNNLKPYDRLRWEFALANIAQTTELGATWNLVVLRQGKDGPDQWARAKAVVAAQQGKGIATAFRLIESPDLYEALSKGGTDAQDALQKYEAWVSELARTFSGDVSFYLVSNEIDHNFGANLLKHRQLYVEFEDYERVLKVAYKSIKKADPAAHVIDHGLSSYSLSLAVADALREEKGVLEAYEFWSRLFFGRDEQTGSRFEFVRLIDGKDAKRRIDVARQTFLSGEYCDYHQLHWYFNPDVLPDVLAWIRGMQQNSAKERPLFVSELGYRMPAKPGKAWDGRKANVADIDRYSERQHAASLLKDVVLFLGEGVRDIQYWQLRVHHERDTSAQLYYPTENIKTFRPTEAARVYGRIIRSFGGDLLHASCSEHDGLMRCDLEFESKVYRVMWVMEGRQEFDVPESALAVYDTTWSQLPRTPRLVIDNDPVIMEFSASTDPGAGG